MVLKTERKTYAEISHNIDPRTLSYADLLETEDWNRKRKEVLKRDRHVCQRCQNRFLKNLRRYIIQDLKDEKDDYDLFHVRSIKGPYLGRVNKPFSNMVTQSDKQLIAEGVYKTGQIIPRLVAAKELTRSDIESFTVSEDFNFKVSIHDKTDYLFVEGLHVHHRFYDLVLHPWEYENDAYQTLCWECHEDLHRNEVVPIYYKGVLKGKGTPCHRCHGAGFLTKYNHVQGGVCFRCRGMRVEELIDKTKEEAIEEYRRRSVEDIEKPL